MFSCDVQKYKQNKRTPGFCKIYFCDFLPNFAKIGQFPDRGQVPVRKKPVSAKFSEGQSERILQHVESSVELLTFMSEIVFACLRGMAQSLTDYRHDDFIPVFYLIKLLAIADVSVQGAVLNLFTEGRIDEFGNLEAVPLIGIDESGIFHG